ncbi:MFS general substrate transporter [Decorospora gaudefroyi]|uniref:MFS general substrate transporter n=1 Tax=Decorospora gaudefroyi TaxID=184978 RepID=A0A6A5KFZ7_9PLEO|nr:MFS general substrate transporter [Decorospora gaudefroyi]
MVKLLLDAGADANAQGGVYGNALHAASAEGHEAVVKLLLNKDADVNAQGGVYGNALHAASSRGHKQVVKTLLKAGTQSAMIHQASITNEEDSPLLSDHQTCSTTQDAPSPVSSNMDTRLIFKTTATMYTFATLGLSTASLGALLPLLAQHYTLTDTQVSTLFLASPIGYIAAAQCSNGIHSRFGQRGIAVAGPLLHILANLTAATQPPRFGVLVGAFLGQGVGTGLLDGSLCAWAGGMTRRANMVSGLLHGSYSVGGALGPVLVAALGRPWWIWYAGLAGASTLSLVVLFSAFRHEDARLYRQSKQSKRNEATIDVKAMFRYRATWLCAAYFLTYVGTETAISGWVVSFMLRHRQATAYVAGLSSSGYWIGMAIGRLTLGVATDRMGVRRATVLYFFFAIGIEALFAIFSSGAVSVVLMILLGFVMGPLFPSGVVVLTRLLPPELHVAAVSFVASLGQVGGAFLPFAIGAVVQGLGIGVFRFAILVETMLALLVWVAFARLRPALLSASTARVED